MGRRGIQSERLKAARAAYDEVGRVDHPWEKEGMPEADQMIAFLETLPIVSGLKAGETLELIEFQRQFVRGVYEPRDDHGDRLVRLAALSVARGNGKSALLSGLGLGHLLGPCVEPYGECYAAALDREQAGVLYYQTRAYIEATPWMGATVLTGLTGDVVIPREIDSPNVGWVAENQALSTDDAAFDTLTLTPHHVGAISEFSRQLAMQGSPDIENLLPRL